MILNKLPLWRTLPPPHIYSVFRAPKSALSSVRKGFKTLSQALFDPAWEGGFLVIIRPLKLLSYPLMDLRTILVLYSLGLTTLVTSDNQTVLLRIPKNHFNICLVLPCSCSCSDPLPSQGASGGCRKQTGLSHWLKK